MKMCVIFETEQLAEVLQIDGETAFLRLFSSNETLELPTSEIWQLT